MKQKEEKKTVWLKGNGSSFIEQNLQVLSRYEAGGKKQTTAKSVLHVLLLHVCE